MIDSSKQIVVNKSADPVEESAGKAKEESDDPKGFKGAVGSCFHFFESYNFCPYSISCFLRLRQKYLNGFCYGLGLLVTDKMSSL